MVSKREIGIDDDYTEGSQPGNHRNNRIKEFTASEPAPVELD